MFFHLKKALMTRTIDKRNKQHPFDCSYAENFSIEGQTDSLLNNSYYFSAHNEEMSVFARLGKRVTTDETWFAVYLGGKLYSLEQEYFPAGKSPVIVEKFGPDWCLSYQGLLNEHDEITFRATFAATQKIIDFTTDMPAARMATGIANEAWNKSFFTELQNVSGQCHYEQEGTLSGQMTLNGKTIDFQLPCVRDHSFGKRDWNYMNNHLWLMAVSPTNQFNYSFVSYPVLSALEVGNYRDETGTHFMLQADLDLRKIANGTIPKELSFSVKLDNTQTIPVTAKTLAGVTYRFAENQYILHENIAEFQIAGNTCRGILEIGFNNDNNRFFNHRNLNTIKR